MNKIVIGALAAVILVGGTITALTQARTRTGPDQQIMPTLTTQQTQVALPGINERTTTNGAVPGFTRENQTVVEGRVVPLNTYNMRFSTIGTVAELAVKEGDAVAKGDIVARLDSRGHELAISAVEAELAEARAELSRVTAGSAPEEIAQYRARLQRAQALREATQSTVTEQDIAAARALIDGLKVKLARLQAVPEAPEVAVGRAQLESARLNLQSVRDTLSARKTVLEAQVAQAANALRDLQDEYERVKALNDSSSKLTQADKDAEARALRAMQNAEQSYHIAQVQYDESRKVEATAIQAAEAGVTVARATLDRVLASQEPDEIALTRAQLTEAEAQLARLGDNYRAAQVKIDQAEIDIAQADLNRAEAQPRAVDIGAAEARVRRAEAELQQSRYATEQLVLRAPANGTIVELGVQVGDVITSGSLAGTLADVSGWQIETSDLSELTIGKLAEGDSVMLTFYAISGLELPGKITRIQPMGRVEVGSDTTYTLLITPDKSDPRLRWNMTTAVRILPK